MMDTPSRKVALITGASAGLGAAFAEAYARRGRDLVLVARRAARLEALANRLATEHGIDALPVTVDLSEPEAQAPILAAMRARGWAADILVNNAGFGIPRRFTEAPWTQQRAFLMTLAVTPSALAYAVLPGMVERGWGRIINVASIAGFAPGVSGNTLYPGVKSLMISFSEALHAEYAGRGVKVTALCPGSTATEFAQAAGYAGRLGPLERRLAQAPETVVEAAIEANEAGRPIIVPGWGNKIAVALLRLLPRPVVRDVIGWGARRYLVGD